MQVVYILAFYLKFCGRWLFT